MPSLLKRLGNLWRLSEHVEFNNDKMRVGGVTSTIEPVEEKPKKKTMATIITLTDPVEETING